MTRRAKPLSWRPVPEWQPEPLGIPLEMPRLPAREELEPDDRDPDRSGRHVIVIDLA